MCYPRITGCDSRKFGAPAARTRGMEGRPASRTLSPQLASHQLQPILPQIVFEVMPIHLERRAHHLGRLDPFLDTCGFHGHLDLAATGVECVYHVKQRSTVHLVEHCHRPRQQHGQLQPFVAGERVALGLVVASLRPGDQAILQRDRVIGDAMPLQPPGRRRAGSVSIHARP